MRVAPGRRPYAILLLLALLAITVSGLRPTSRVRAQEAVEIWGQPVNLSASGAASQPALVAAPDGSLHALWWDQFDGTKYAAYTAAGGWGKAVEVLTIAGGRERTGEYLPPKNLVLLADATNYIHAFWIADDGDLLYARKRIGFGDWTGALQLATTPLAWDVRLDARSRLHLALIRSTPVGNLPAGVYYRQGTSNGATWGNSILVVESLYFRSMPAEAAHVHVASDSAAEVIVDWDDPQLGQSLYARLAPTGRTFGEPVAIIAGAATGDLPPERARLTPQADGSFLALWHAGDGCAVYQQVYTPSTDLWTLPVRVLDSLETCAVGQRSYTTSDGKLFTAFTMTGGGVALAAWDGVRWSEPFASQIRFIHPLTQRATFLGCLSVTLSLDQVAVIGCDENGDVWVTTSQLALNDLLPALHSAWTAPVIMSAPVGEAGVPAIAVDSDSIMHVLWSESAPSGGVGLGLRYARGDGTTWSTSGVVLRSPEGRSEQPSLAADPGGLLHAVWSGGDSGRIWYSQAFVRDGPTAAGWSVPVAIPAPQTVGASPNLLSDANGVLHLLYVIPLNESRGVYYVRSDDRGQTWTEPMVVFDAVEADWPRVAEAHLTRDGAGRLHAVWTRNALPEDLPALGTYYARSDDNGQTWSPAVELSLGDVDHPRLIAASNDAVHATWVAWSLGKLELWHRVSLDAGQTWSEPLRVLDTTAGLGDQVNLATDGHGNVFLSGIQRTAESSAGLFSLQWTGDAWGDYQRVSLGYEATEEAGALPVLLPSGTLGALYRVRVPYVEGGAYYSIGYTQRPVIIEAMEIVPTFTPPPPPTSTTVPTVAATMAPSATPNLSQPAALPTDDKFWLRVGGIAAAMLLVTVVAVGRLWGARQR